MEQEQIIYFSKDICVSVRSTEKHLLEEKLQIFCRPYGKSDYIPCICWGRNARYASGFEVGEHVQLLGRIQSREYVKRISDTETEKRVAYEVSVSKLEKTLIDSACI